MVAQLPGMLSDGLTADQKLVVKFVVVAGNPKLVDRYAGIGAGRPDDVRSG